MALTPEYKCLKKRLSYLQSTLPSANLAKTSLTQLQIDNISAFALLTHAGCEEFVEARCRSLADDALKKFTVSGFFGRVARHLCILPFIDPPKERSDFGKLDAVVGCAGFGIMANKTFASAFNTQIGDLLKVGYGRYKRAIEGNHGIAKQYQFRLLGAIGFDRSKLDPTFSSRIGQLAALRGEAAHKTTVTVTTIPEPSDLSTWSTDLITGFKVLDSELTKLGKRQC